MNVGWSYMTIVNGAGTLCYGPSSSIQQGSMIQNYSSINDALDQCDNT